MRLLGKLIKETRVLKEAVVEKAGDNGLFRDTLECCLIDLCRELDIGVPIWLRRNTREFSFYRRTSFFSDQFMEKVEFDRFEIKVM